jgi:hypothetical protein
VHLSGAPFCIIRIFIVIFVLDEGTGNLTSATNHFWGSLYDAVSSQTMWCRIVWWIEKSVKGSVCCLIWLEEMKKTKTLSKDSQCSDSDSKYAPLESCQPARCVYPSLNFISLCAAGIWLPGPKLFASYYRNNIHSCIRIPNPVFQNLVLPNLCSFTPQYVPPTFLSAIIGETPCSLFLVIPCSLQTYLQTNTAHRRTCTQTDFKLLGNKLC